MAQNDFSIMDLLEDDDWFETSARRERRWIVMHSLAMVGAVN